MEENRKLVLDPVGLQSQETVGLCQTTKSFFSSTTRRGQVKHDDCWHWRTQ